MTESGLPEHVSLRADHGLPWVHVSRALVTARSIILIALALAVAVAGVLLTVTLSGWFWLLTAAAVLGAAWGWWVIRRQVSAITYAELSEELVIRRGRIFRRMVSIPYGRLQYVDLQSGPLSRRLGIARLELHTASPESGGDIPGVELDAAERLRERLTARGESQRAGL